MELHQEARKRFIDDREVLADTKTPELISLKLLEEVGELLVAYSEYQRTVRTPEHFSAVKEETADVANILMDIAIHCGFDLGQAISDKRQKDEKRFPAETMKREPGKTAQQIYMRRKVALGERKMPVAPTQKK